VNIELQVLGSALRSIAEEMGAVLVRSAFSANIKERRDCSTALFDSHGRMVVQAEHIPVHLGAMPDAVAAVRALEPAREEIYILNDPYAGGTHLPDITLVSRTDVGFAVTRAHHADVGGREPGSMPADSTRLDEEGVVIPPTRLDDALLDELLARMRNPEERRGDLRAQLAAHALAERRIAELCERRTHGRIVAAIDELYAYSERRVRAAIARLPDGVYESSDVLEDGDADLALAARVQIDGDEIAIDFTGTAPQHEGNLNCPLSVTRSAAYFVVRCLTDPDVPSSGGAFAPVTVTAPAGCLVNSRAPAAVAGGNVETSNRIVDVLFNAFAQALPVPAQGQGTMNNVTLGNDRFTYYETIGGGQGACPDSDGPSGAGPAATACTVVETASYASSASSRRAACRSSRSGGDTPPQVAAAANPEPRAGIS
jgi:N-methylhydantoinase B